MTRTHSTPPTGTPSAGARLRRTVPDTTRNAIETHVYDAQSLLGLTATRPEALADEVSGDTSRELTALALVADAAAECLDVIAVQLRGPEIAAA